MSLDAETRQNALTCMRSLDRALPPSGAKPPKPTAAQTEAMLDLGERIAEAQADGSAE